MSTKEPLIAAIDVGTNSFHLAVCSVNSRGVMNILLREKEVVRLGSGTGDMKELTEDAMNRGTETLSRFAELAKSQKAQIRAVATSAVREALNKDVFLHRVNEATGIEIEVVSGAEEGRLIFLGALNALPLMDKNALVVDIGGGSTETIVGLKGDIAYLRSTKLGAIRMTKRFQLDTKPTKNNIQKCREFIAGEIAPNMKRIAQYNCDTLVGTSGTIINIALMSIFNKRSDISDVFNGICVTRQQLLKTIKKIASARTIEERKAIPGMDPERADIILGGALILEQILLSLSINNILLSSYALREGIVFDTFRKKHDLIRHHNLMHQRYQTIYSLATEYKVDMNHAEHVRNTALRLFDALKPIHKLSWAERELLEAAAILHDVGYLISREQHHKHSYYIISNCIMQGFTNDEAEIIANIARYHRKSHPKKKHENFIHLSEQKQLIIKLLASFLRIGEGIDRRQQQNVKEIKVLCSEKNIIITVFPKTGDNHIEIEVWGANRRKLLLEETLGRTVSIVEFN